MCVFKHELFLGSCRGEPGGEPQRREEDGERAHAQHAAGRPHSTAAGRQEVSLDHTYTSICMLLLLYFGFLSFIYYY